MSETESIQPTITPHERYQRWRLVKDKLMGYAVVAGGLSVILAVVLILFYLLYVVFPLLLPAHAELKLQYPVPSVEQGNTLWLSVEEQNEVGVRFSDKGAVLFFAVADGKTLKETRLPIAEGVSITSFAQGGLDKGLVAFGLSNGQVLVARHEYKLSYPGGKRVITPSLQFPLGEQALVLDSTGQALLRLAIKSEDKSSTLVAKTADQRLLLLALSKKESAFDDEVSLERTETALDMPADDIDYLLIDKQQSNLYLATRAGELTVYDIREKSTPTVKHKLNLLKQGVQLTSLVFLNGDLSLLVGDSSGEVGQWSAVRDANNHFSIEKLRYFKVAESPIVLISSEQRRKGFIAVADNGEFGVYNATAEREAIKTSMPSNGKPVALSLSPRANTLLLQEANGQLQNWHIDNEHPEVSWKSLWGKVWYESYPAPGYTWQSSSASNDFEPKMSLVPLVFGTLKASFYAMLVAIPLSLFGAIYTGYFMAPTVRQYVKPGIEIMGALPTVILGFLAGLWLAPFVETHLTGIFAQLIVVPLGVIAFAFAWQHAAPKACRNWLPDGWDAIALIPAVLFSSWLALQVGPMMETWLFNGDLRGWMSSELGIGYDQRNTLVVGLAMGFAVVPMIFSIAEDAIFSVPKHLTTGSLALGATPWQTLVKVVILTASPGIFSAIMIGFGRAVGETMIVLMATGNTPVMDWSIFQGLRTLSANIAVEMPESEFNSTHYRVLFLAALVLFTFTFIVNSLAELVRQNLRQKYSSL